jgi:hypothetical protein
MNKNTSLHSSLIVFSPNSSFIIHHSSFFTQIHHSSLIIHHFLPIPLPPGNVVIPAQAGIQSLFGWLKSLDPDTSPG